MKTEDLSLAQQNYVETIAELIEDHGHAHPTEIARQLDVRKPSVTEAVDRLVEAGIATRSGYKVCLTSIGMKLAGELMSRHATLRTFMADILGMSPAEADDAACRMEHTTSRSFIRTLKQFCGYMRDGQGACAREDWMQSKRRI